MVLMRRQWTAWACGAALTLALSRWAPVTHMLPLLGLLALGRALCGLAALWLAPALPRRLLEGGVARRALLVTGCDSGFGHAAALRLHSLGATVFAGVLQPRGAGAERLRALASTRMRVLPLDVTDDASVAAAAAAVAKDAAALGLELWAIVNNAGILNIGEAEWMDLNDITKTLDVNALGQVRVTKAFLPLLKKSKGRVVNINSLASTLAVTNLTPYTMSKFASFAFTETLRMDMNGFGVSVHSIEPTIYQTPMAENLQSIFKQKLAKIPDEIISTYCDSYAEKVLKMVDFILNTMAVPSSKIYQVIDDIEDACLAQDPQDHYFPGESSKFLATFRDLVPVGQRALRNYFLR